MGVLIYSTNMSLDGYIEDAEGKFDWTAPDEEVHRFINNLLRPVSIHLYGRRLYETMAVWETDPSLAEVSPAMRDFAGIWHSVEKVVYSRTLETAVTGRTRIERTFDAESVRRLKDHYARMLVGGADLAAQAFRAGLVDECHVFLYPIIAGGGKPGLPGDTRVSLRLEASHAFSGGVVYCRYRVR